MKNFLTGLFLILVGLLIAGILLLVASPPRGEPVTLLPPPTPLPIVVHVIGAVNTPGVYHLPPGSRVQDAVNAAGGFLSESDPSNLNLAAPVQDGMQIRVGTFSPPPQANPIAETLLNINTATTDELATLPGIGPITAQRIIDYRTQFGPFTSIEDLTQVFGIGPTTLDQIKDLITLTP